MRNAFENLLIRISQHIHRHPFTGTSFTPGWTVNVTPPYFCAQVETSTVSHAALCEETSRVTLAGVEWRALLDIGSRSIEWTRACAEWRQVQYFSDSCCTVQGDRQSLDCRSRPDFEPYIGRMTLRRTCLSILRSSGAPRFVLRCFEANWQMIASVKRESSSSLTG
jgi:hypothetical protein